MNYYRPKYYTLEELAHPQIIKTIGPDNTWKRLNPRALKDLDTIRECWYEKTGSGVYVNRLGFGLDSRGLRPPNDPDGSFYSIHKQGAAFDIEPVKGTIDALWALCYDLIYGGELKCLNTLEDTDFTPGWVHIAHMNHDEKVLIINP